MEAKQTIYHLGMNPFEGEPETSQCQKDSLAMRTFDTGATRNPDTDKRNYEGFLSPLVIKRFGEYMHKHRFQADGQLRDADNWQKGIPLKSFAESLWRHFLDFWLVHRGYNKESNENDIEESLCAIIFNASGYLHELRKRKL